MSDTSTIKAPAKRGDAIFGVLTSGASVFTLLMLGGIIASLVVASWPTITAFGFDFLFTANWDPPIDEYGALVPIYGTLVTSFIALIIAVPISFGIALFLTELSRLGCVAHWEQRLSCWLRCLQLFTACGAYWFLRLFLRNTFRRP
jgi:phosphate transport system permease protein